MEAVMMIAVVIIVRILKVSYSVFSLDLICNP